jgi:hypothetical protein
MTSTTETARVKKSTTGKTKTGDATKAIRRLDERFVERRFEPAAAGSAYLGAVAMSLGGIALGMGSYALLALQGRPTYDWGRWLIVLGAGLVCVYLVAGSKKVGALRVGELGVGFEEEGKVSRTAWCDITKVSLVDRALKLATAGKSLLIPLDAYPVGAARAAREAKTRIPKRVALEDEDLGKLGSGQGGSEVEAEPPQVTEEQCRATGEALTFEKDVRMCGRCGALYHRSGVPKRCLDCGKKLKSAT